MTSLPQAEEQNPQPSGRTSKKSRRGRIHDEGGKVKVVLKVDLGLKVWALRMLRGFRTQLNPTWGTGGFRTAARGKDVQCAESRPLSARIPLFLGTTDLLKNGGGVEWRK